MGPRENRFRGTAPGVFDRPALLAALEAGLGELDLGLDRTARERLIDYLRLLAKWNAVYNLTAVRAPQAMLVQHLFDSLSIVRPLAELGPFRTVVDVGSGGGLPGVVLAIVWPEAGVHLVEPVGKKAAFLRQCVAELTLGRTQVHATHIEELARRRDISPELVVCRAFASLRDFVAGLGDFANPPAVVAAMKGQLPLDEIEELPPDWRLTRAIPLRVPQLGARRHLLLLERRAEPAPAAAHRSDLE